MKTPLVTIAITVFNGGELIPRAIESALKQTYSNLEILILDDTSTDNTGEVINQYREKDRRIVYVRNDKNIGYSRSLLKMAELVRGEYIQLLGADDWLAKNYIEVMVSGFESHADAACIAAEIVTLRAMPDNGFDFLNTYLPKGSKITKGYYLRNVYKTALSTLTAFALFRKADFFESTKFMVDTFSNLPSEIPEELQKLHFKGFSTETLFLLKAIGKYKYFVLTDKTTYIKTQHFANENKQYAKSVDWVSAGRILRWYYYNRLAYEYLFKTDYKKYFRRLRIFFGSDPFVSIAVVFMKKKFEKGFFGDWISSDLKTYFKAYSFLEIIIALFFLPVRLFERLVLFCGRILRRKNKGRNIVRPDFFIGEGELFKA
jgi:glycosyltransferase involved in cell wall biosynthesis